MWIHVEKNYKSCMGMMNLNFKWGSPLAWRRGWDTNGFAKGLVAQKVKRLPAMWETWIGKIPWRRKWQSTPALLPGESHGWRSLIGCSPWGRKELDTTERLLYFSLSCIGEGNGNPLQCSCLENPSDGGAWWAAVYGVTQSWTRLKRLSSSSSMRIE